MSLSASTSVALHHNAPLYSVSELAHELKRTVEQEFSYVAVRGEISGLKAAPSGHVYLSLKDQQAVLSAVCWRGTYGTIRAALQEGMEVVCRGKMTTFAGQSKYQLVIEHAEPAGIGALMALLERRKAMLAAEGLFAPERKRTLPFLPRCIGVITSPTGAVIRDILHRIQERFPLRVVLWPVLVQGEQAASQIAAAIEGMNRLTDPAPDVIIVARGGGSLEDLWAFNEEIVVRATAASRLPLISAVGHETDTTLIDYASDRRAPTPTAAAEIATPVRQEVLQGLAGLEDRMSRAMTRQTTAWHHRLTTTTLRMPTHVQILQPAIQRLDMAVLRWERGMETPLSQARQRLTLCSGRLRSPKDHLSQQSLRLQRAEEGLRRSMQDALQRAQSRMDRCGWGRPQWARLNQQHAHSLHRIATTARALVYAWQRTDTQKVHTMHGLVARLEKYDVHHTLSRGFALIYDAQTGAVCTHGAHLPTELPLHVQFQDGTYVIGGSKHGMTIAQPM